MCGVLNLDPKASSQRRPDPTETIELYAGKLSRSLRVCDNGVQVGCTFVSKAALEFIIQKWNDRELYD